MNNSALDLNNTSPSLPYLASNEKRLLWHYAYFHETSQDLVDSICRFLVPALKPEHAGIIVATREHIESVISRGPHFGLDISGAMERGQLVVLDAEELLHRFMLNEMPDPVRFRVIVGTLMKDLAEKFPYLHVYGEMVAILWEEGNEKATIALEELWNDMARLRPFCLLCGYPKRSFNGKATQYEHICGTHTHVNTV